MSRWAARSDPTQVRAHGAGPDTPGGWPVTVRWKGRRAQNKWSIPLESWRLGDSRIVVFENLPTPFFGNVGFIKFGTFSALLALPVMIRDGYGQIVYETLPHILLSNASLVTKSCIARLVEGDAFNPSAQSDCSTGPLPHWRTQSRLCRHPGPARPIWPLSLDLRTNGSRSRKIRAQCEIPPFHVL